MELRELKKQLKNCKEQNLRLINENKKVMNNKIKQVFDDIEKNIMIYHSGEVLDDYFNELKKKHLR